MKTKILKSGWIKTTPIRKDMDKLKIDKIKINDCRSYSDSTFIERVLFYFHACDNIGANSDSDNRFLIVMDVETEYFHEESVNTALRQQLSRFPILHIEEIVQAFRYRRHCCTF